MLQLVIVRIYYAISILMPILLFAFRTEKRSRFALRITVSLIVILILNILSSIGYYYGDKISFFSSKYYDLIYFLVSLVLSFVLCYFCFNQTFLCSIYCGTAGYCIQHFWGKLVDYEIFMTLKSIPVLARYLISFCILVGMCFAIYYFLIRKMIPKGGNYAFGKTSQILISLVIIGSVIIYNTIAQTYIDNLKEYVDINQMASLRIDIDNLQMFINVITSLIALLCFLLLVGLYQKNVDISEIDNLNNLIAEQKRQFDLEKINVNLINIKCHDLKHQLSAMKGKISQQEIDETLKAIEIYDSSIHTENEAIDIILSSKSLYCKSKKIKLTCNLNGRLLEFIPSSELYSIFGNAIENAIESVEKLSEDKRFIHITQQINGNLLNITIENYYEGEIVFENGLPKTKKDQGLYHGFGLKSITMLVEKHGGHVNVTANDGKFVLNLFFIIPMKIINQLKENS